MYFQKTFSCLIIDSLQNMVLNFRKIKRERVLVVIIPTLPRDGGTAQTAIQVRAVNLIEIRLRERWQPISNQSCVTGSATTNKADCHWWVPKSRLLRHAGLATS